MQRQLKLHTFYSFPAPPVSRKTFFIQPKMRHTRSPSSIGTNTLSSPKKSHCCFFPHFSPVILACLPPKMKTHPANRFPEANVLPDSFFERSSEALLSASLHESPYHQPCRLGDSSRPFGRLWMLCGVLEHEKVMKGSLQSAPLQILVVKVVDVTSSQDYKEVGLILDKGFVIKASKSIVRVLCKALKVI